MKFLIPILIPFLTFGQDYTLEEIGDNYLFNPFSPVFTYSNNNFIAVKRNSNKIGLLIYIDSSKTQSFVERFYETGMISMIITEFEFNVRSNDSTFLYCTSGKVKTFYPNGKLRSEYYLDSLGNIQGEIKQYSVDGVNIESIQFKNGVFWNGVYVYKWDEGYIVCFIKNGVKTNTFYYKKDEWYTLENDIISDRVKEKRKLNRIRKTYFLDEYFALTFPQNINWE